MCARCGDTVEASRCAARAGARANDTARAEVRVDCAARARASARADEAARDSARPAPTLTFATAPARTIASLAAVMAAAAAGGGMHGYLQGRDATEQASISSDDKVEVEVEAAWRIPLASARGHIRSRRYRGIQHWMRAHQHAGHIRQFVITNITKSAEGGKRWRSSSSCACSQR